MGLWSWLGKWGLGIDSAYIAGSDAQSSVAAIQPQLATVDQTHEDRDKVHARVADLARNDPYQAGALIDYKTNMVGPNYRLRITPDQSLNMSREARNDWAKRVQSAWINWAESPNCWIDAQRQMTFSDMMRAAAVSDFLHGESFFILQWRENSSTISGCYRMIDPMHVQGNGSNEWGGNVKPILNSSGIEKKSPLYGLDPFQLSMGANGGAYGIMRNEWGEPVKYRVKIDESSYGNLLGFAEIPRYNQDGYLQVIHTYTQTRPNQSRGISRVASIVPSSLQLHTFAMNEAQKQTLGSSIVMYIRSPDRLVNEIMGMSEDVRQAAFEDAYKTNCATAERLQKLLGDSVKIIGLHPGEDVVNPDVHESRSNFPEFIDHYATGFAKGIGASPSLFTGKPKGNYSGQKVEMANYANTIETFRAEAIDKPANIMLRNFAIEAYERGILAPPDGVDFYDNIEGLLRCEWFATAPLQLDESKTALANEKRIRDMTITSRNVAESDGYDYDDMQEQIEQGARDVIQRAEEISGMEMTERDKQKVVLSAFGFVDQATPDQINPFAQPQNPDDDTDQTDEATE